MGKKRKMISHPQLWKKFANHPAVKARQPQREAGDEQTAPRAPPPKAEVPKPVVRKEAPKPAPEPAVKKEAPQPPKKKAPPTSRRRRAKPKQAADPTKKKTPSKE